ncbi:hypothetical protein FEM48_Zijuj06G0186100 [Ziziphus jujuba var. spinosa]|uniref:Tryptophan aminotransferase-related protein 4-like n=1 Tax=Ziziphus jujuba var. spinosa TaxID=714518 RepID=A0A978VAY5_ZIZJJ|nr:hypothetical protein FEM48_Zijuj06G0186100 [Ziziphus jujuba var. spinosa]
MLSVNILFAVRVYVVGVDGLGELSWSRKAAEQAEAVAAISCSGHGRAYLDGIILDGEKPICECNPCYGGLDCSHFLPNCSADAESGDPYFLEPFWMQNAESSAILVSGWHRMGYSFLYDQSYISKVLENHIRKLHGIVGNAITSGRYIIFGAGSAQLLNAAVHALSPTNASSPPAKVFVSIPFYSLYESQTEFFDSKNYNFEGDTRLWKNESHGNDTSLLIEFVTSPNNPDGKLNKAVLNGTNARAIYDRVYYWPHYTAVPAPADEDIMVFSISKLTGHAGSRFGWAVIKDEGVFERMTTYLATNTMGVSRDTQLRALKLINTVLKGRKGRDIFEFGYQKMSDRWEKLSQTLSVSTRFSLQKIEDQYCRFFDKVIKPSPAYAWVKCEREEDKDCYEVLKAANITGREGSVYGAENRYVRLALIRSQDDFDLLLKRLNNLVSKEEEEEEEKIKTM